MKFKKKPTVTVLVTQFTLTIIAGASSLLKRAILSSDSILAQKRDVLNEGTAMSINQLIIEEYAYINIREMTAAAKLSHARVHIVETLFVN